MRKLSPRPVLHLALAAALLAAMGCGDWMAPPREVPFPEIRPQPAYEALFPSYVELCALSQIRPLDAPFGGSAGHGVMYLKGACKDEAAPYPRLRRCRGTATSTEDLEHGAGVSVNQVFRNVNWVAVPGKALFYQGLLPPEERFTRERFSAAAQAAIEQGVYAGVVFRDDPDTGAAPTLDDFVAADGLGTDFALRLTRTLFCARLPVTSEMLDEIVDFLNDLNRQYATGAADYRWSGIHDNCVHTLRNALAAASIWEPKSINLIKLRQLFQLAIPANEVATLAQVGTNGPLGDFDAIYGEDAWRTALLEFGWLPTRHGALLSILPVHQSNDMYDTTFRQLILEGPLGRGTTQRVRELFLDERNLDLRDNLIHFRDEYQRILAGRSEAAPEAELRGGRRRTVRRRYERYIEAQLADVNRQIEELARRNGARTSRVATPGAGSP
jgi:hypothetical protein